MALILSVLADFSLRAAPPTPLPPVGALWLYAPMDSSLHPAIAENVLLYRYRQWTQTRACTSGAPQPAFRPGIAASGLFLNAPGPTHPGDTLQYLLDTRTFPRRAGSVTLWYRPKRPLEQETVWLMGMGWCSLQLTISGGRLNAYATSSARTGLYAPLKKQKKNWADTWHFLAMTWNGPLVRAYVDGERIGERADVKPLDAVKFLTPWLDLGFLPPGGKRQTPVAYASGVLDEFSIWSEPLTDAQIARLAVAGQKEKYHGLFSLLGDGTLLRLNRHAFLRGEAAKLRFFFCGQNANRADILANDGQRDLLLAKWNPRTGLGTLRIDTAQLRPGRYLVRADLFQNGRRINQSKSTLLVIQARRQPPFPVGLGSNFASSDAALAQYEKMHISLISANGPADLPSFSRQLDRAFTHGIGLFPNFNILETWGRRYATLERVPPSLKKAPYFVQDAKGTWRVNPETAWKYLQTLVYADGSPDTHTHTSSASPFSPVAWDIMAETVRENLTAAGDSPGLWAVSFQDEVPFRWNNRNPKRRLRVGDYSFYAIKHFKKVTGLSAPAFPPVAPPGTIWPDTLPYLRWMRNIGLPGSDFTNIGLSTLYARLGREVKKYRPDVFCGNYSGGEYGLNDFVLDWQYPVIWEPHANGWGAGGGFLDYIFDRHWARQRVRPRKPLWALLGWWSGDMVNEPDWCVADFRLNTVMALAKGVRQLMWFTGRFNPKNGRGTGIFSRPDLQKEAEKWAGFLHEKGAVFTWLKKKPSHRVAVLWSETNRAGHVQSTPARPDYYLIFSALRTIGAAPDLITDPMIRNGVLDQYEALVLCEYDYASRPLWEKISAFAKQPGKTVFIDAASHLIPPHAVPLGAKWNDLLLPPLKKWTAHGPRIRTRAVGRWANRLRPLVLPRLSPSNLEIDSDHGMIGAHLLWAEQTPYLFIINLDLDQTRSAVVRFRTDERVAYNLISGNMQRPPVKNGKLEFRETLAPGDAAIYLLARDEVEKLSLNAHAMAGAIFAECAILHRQPLSAAWPLHVELFDPNGQRAYERWTSTDTSGHWNGVFRLGRITDPSGNWQLKITELLTRRHVTVPVSAKIKNRKKK